MKATLITIVLAGAVICSCGTAKKTASADPAAEEERIYASEAVDVGYGHVKKDELTYSVSEVKVNKDDVGAYHNIWDYIRGRVPGVSVGYASAGQTPDITIRGVNSINASTQPLILVDGIEMSDISYLSPNEVANVSVLKDASSSMYGVRGANGVILITTKAAEQAAQDAAAARKAAKAAKQLMKKNR